MPNRGNAVNGAREALRGADDPSAPRKLKMSSLLAHEDSAVLDLALLGLRRIVGAPSGVGARRRRQDRHEREHQCDGQDLLHEFTSFRSMSVACALLQGKTDARCRPTGGVEECRRNHADACVGGRRVAWPEGWRGLFARVRWPTGAIAPSMTVPTPDQYRAARRRERPDALDVVGVRPEA